MLLVGSVVLIVLAIGMVALLDRTGGGSKDTGSQDVRARAAVSKTLMMNGNVVSVDENAGTITVNNVFLADESRSGEAKDLGTWIVTPPATVSLGSMTPGSSIAIGVDAKTFLASKHTMTAVTLVVKSK